MVDFVKVTARISQNEVPRLVSTLDLRQTVNPETGAFSEWPLRGKLKNLDLTIASGRECWLEVSGSLHRWFEGKTNYGQFPFSSLRDTVERLRQTLEVGPARFAVRQLEIGVNLAPPPMPSGVILAAVIGYGAHAFGPMRTSGAKSIGQNASTADYGVKLYSKTRQFDLDTDVMRFEIQARQHVGRVFGVHTLADVIEPGKMAEITPILTRYAGRMVLDDEVPLSQLNVRQRAIFEAGRNPRTFVTMPARERREFVNLLHQHGQRQTGRRFAEAVAKTFTKLLEN